MRNELGLEKCFTWITLKARQKWAQGESNLNREENETWI